MSPIIGIPAVDSTAIRNFRNYEKAIEEYGGVVQFLIRGEQTIKEFITGIDGLVLPGGGDIHPKHFNQEWHPKLKFVDEDRDELEISLFKEAFEKDTPVLGICCGIQVMSVAMGGSLYQDIKSEYPKKALTHQVKGQDARHKIKLEPECKLGKIIGEGVDVVNSAHHQAVDDIGNGFVVAARSEDGIVEAIENPTKPFVIGVQYHPERMTETEIFCEHRQKLFKAFIAAASK